MQTGSQHCAVINCGFDLAYPWRSKKKKLRERETKQIETEIAR